ncbi:protein-disulfide reductase DsbD [Lampropedia aestuarii]|uniref:protein-disulfide reductase DsbD n=1 Tax=Lampropedia aestuarii TaxID=2562762 RepID=UPI00246919AB|nr:protein-disulfide reductase DsbD [Lampropedia aestuarii]MDH5856498.1 protein-disulfide reductase DsbD [Lampropedia aestuarii]
MLYRRLLTIVVLCSCALSSAWAQGIFSPWNGGENQFLDAAEVLKLKPAQQQGDVFTIDSQIAENYYVYRHAIKLVDQAGNEIALDLPAGRNQYDEFFGNTEIYTDQALALSFPDTVTGPLTLHWQGCAEAGICYPPQTTELRLPASEAVSAAASSQPVSVSVSMSEAAPQTAAPAPSPPGPLAEDQAAAQQLATLDPFWGVLLFFGFGLLLAFTPCSLPMIPIISSMVVGSQAKPRRAFALSLSYVVAMAGTYAIVGVAAAMAGANLQATLQSPWLLSAFAVLFLVLASSLFGLFELRLPACLMNRLQSAGQGQSGGSWAGAAMLGVLSALLVGPCMTAPLAGALLYIGQTGSAAYGAMVLFALGLGMGLPLLAIAVFGAQVLPRPGAWMDRVRVAFGYVMVGMALMMLARFLPATLSLALWGAWLLSIAIGLLAWGQALVSQYRLVWTLRLGAVLASLWGTLMVVGAAAGGDSLLQPLAQLRNTSNTNAPTSPAFTYLQAKTIEDVQAHITQAGAKGQWTLLDFYADWCVSCHVIERQVFGDPTVAARLARMQVVRPDVTRNDADDQALLKHWGVLGPPTLILIGPDGKERRELRSIGELDARAFLARLDQAGTP